MDQHQMPQNILSVLSDNVETINVLANIKGSYTVGTDQQNTMRTYDRVWGTFDQAGLPASPPTIFKPSMGDRPHENREVTILESEFYKKGVA